MTDATLLSFNAGSSSVKIGVFRIDANGPVKITRGTIDFHRDPLTFYLGEGADRIDFELEANPGDDLFKILSKTFSCLSSHVDIGRIAAIGHRVVHGGDWFAGPTLLDHSTIGVIEALTPFAPLHQPQSLGLIQAVREIRPDLPQAASFDTAFHRTNAAVVRRFAIPRGMHDRGIKRYGFHGLSYKSIATELTRRTPEIAAGKVVIAHLGSGASLCAIEGGKSRDTSMGFSTLDGIPMATRCGALDPGVLLHMLDVEQQTPAQLADVLYHRSGLLGISGLSADSRELLQSEEPEAREAIELFTFRIAGEVARLATTLGGIDALVFTAGVGENQPSIRGDVCAHLMWLGVDLDPVANAVNAAVISSPASRIAVLVVPTDEEQVIADEAHHVLGSELC